MDFPIGNILTAAATVVAVVIANRLTFSRTNKERLWDLRRQAYGVIVTEFAAMERVYVEIDGFIGMHGEEAYFRDEQMFDDGKVLAAHMSEANSRFADDYLVLSDQFIQIYEQMLDEIHNTDPNVAGMEGRKAVSVAVRAARPKLLAQARSEMKLPRWWSF
jgi:hypothetical protein